MKRNKKIGLLILLFAAVTIITVLVVKGIRRSADTIADELLKDVAAFASDEMKDKDDAVRLNKLANSNPADSVAYKAVMDYARTLMMRGQQADVFRMLSPIVSADSEFVSDISDTKRVDFILRVYVLLGAAAEENGMLNLSMEFYTKGLALAKEVKNEKKMASLYNNIGVCYFRMKEYSKARSYFNNALQLNKNLHSNYDIFLNYNNLSEIDMLSGDMKSALNNALLAMQYLDAADHKDEEVRSLDGYIQTQIAAIYRQKGDMTKARSYTENAIALLEAHGQKTDLMEGYLLSAQLYQDAGEHDSALLWIREAERISRPLGNLNLSVKVLERLADIEKLKGENDSALIHLSQAYQYKDSIALHENRNRMDQCQTIYEYERKMNDKSSFLAKQDPVKVFVVCSVIFIVLVVILIKWAVERRRLRVALEAKNKLDDEVKQLHESQLEESRLKQEELRESLDLSHRQLTSFTMQKLKTKEQAEDIIKDMKLLLTRINPRSPELREQVQQLITKLSRYKVNDDWAEFNYYFERVNSDFFNRLTLEHPGITEKQKRICALLYLGLNTKEIAQITFREVRSIESSRTRLRKKLGLSSDEDLNTYFRKYAQPENNSEESGNGSGTE